MKHTSIAITSINTTITTNQRRHRPHPSSSNLSQLPTFSLFKPDSGGCLQRLAKWTTTIVVNRPYANEASRHCTYPHRRSSAPSFVRAPVSPFNTHKSHCPVKATSVKRQRGPKSGICRPYRLLRQVKWPHCSTSWRPCPLNITECPTCLRRAIV